MAQSSITECNAAVDARNTMLNGGTVELRSGPVGDVDSAVTGTLLETIALPVTAFGVASNRVATMNAVTPISALSANAGGQVHYVARNSSGSVSRVGSAGAVGTDMILSTLTWTVGDEIRITNWTTNQPK